VKNSSIQITSELQIKRSFNKNKLMEN